MEDQKQKPPSKILSKIVKLFALGQDDRNVSEDEMLLAMTRAKELMARYNISMAEVEANIQGHTNAEKIKWNIRVHSTYERKMRSFASYDTPVMWATAKLTETQPIIRRRTVGGSHYVQLVFLGDENDVAVAAELYMLILEGVRRAARTRYGSGWSKDHTSYALGFGHRLVDRADQMVNTLTATEANTLALVVASKHEAIQRELADMDLKTEKRRASTVNPHAYAQGYTDGAHMSLNKTGLRG